MAPCRAALASGHRVAAVDPDPEVARALDVALSPWEVTLVDVHLDSPGAVMPMAVDRARVIATDAGAEVVVWVSSADDGFAVWIYDAASDHASARKLERAPPFDGPTAAGVALSVKTLLRGTAVAPPLERFGAVPGESPWRLGLSGGVAQRIQAASPIEARLGGEASGWLGRWGFMLDVEGGPGWHPSNAALTGTVTDTALRLAVGVHLPLSPAVAVEPSVGAGLRLVHLDAVVVSDLTHASLERADGAFEPRLGVEVGLFHGHLRFIPWVGAIVMTRWQRFQVEGKTALEIAPFAVEGALCAAVAIP
jgi:hypothetical protein